MIALVQLPDGASLERTQKTLDKVFEITRKTPGVARVVNIAGVSALDNSATLSSAGVSYIILKDWSERGMTAGGKLVEVRRISITDAGRRAIEA